MDTKSNELEQYLMKLDSKGFKFKDDAISFIYFGKQLTGANDFLVSTAIEWTLKTQKSFDGSFYLSLLETLNANKISKKTEAIRLIEEIGLIKNYDQFSL